ncbi:MAG: hemolysin III family protein [Bacteroidota bacterium]
MSRLRSAFARVFVDRHETPAEEFANALTHGIGFVLSGIGLALLVRSALETGTGWRLASALTFGLALLFTYGASTIYHAVRRGGLKDILCLIDHISIFVLIAGSYTPFLLSLMQDGFGWTFFSLIWGVAIFGIIYKLIAGTRFTAGSLLLYLGMGWMAVFLVKPLFAALPYAGFLWLVAGGLCYTLGCAFYVWRRLPYSHALWHLFVMAGSACHFVAIFRYVL